MDKKKFGVAVFGFLVLLILFFAFGKHIRTQNQKKKLRLLNVILITIDTLRSDRLSCYSDTYAQTPNLDLLAQEGVVFESCISQTPLTLPAHTTILSGTYPLYHQVRDNGGFVVPQKLTLLSEILSQHDYATSAFVAAYVLHSKWGLNRGFDIYSDTFKDESGDRVISLVEIQKRANEVLQDASAWLVQKKDSKFFCWIHLYDPHAPYDPPSPFKEKYTDRPYEGEVAYTDEELGKFFAFLKKEGLWNNTLIVVTGDHGESLWEHEEETHGFFVYDSAVWVPLVIKAPVVFPVKRIKNVVEHVDVAPTILEILDIPAPESMQGKSLLSLMWAKEKNWPDTAYTETYYPRLHFGWSELSAMYHQNWKFIMAPNEEFYDLSKDKAEKENLVRSGDGQMNKMKVLLQKLITEKSRQALSQEANQKLDRESIKKLAALGYISSFSDVDQKKDMADPKDKIKVHNDLNDAKQLYLEKKYDTAVDVVKKILAQDPHIIDAHMFLGNLYFSQNRFQEACSSFQEVLQRKPDYNFAMINVLNCLINTGELDKAVSECQKYLQIFPRDTIFLFTLGDIYFLKKEYDQALSYLFSALKIDASYTEALNKIGEIYSVKHDYLKAEEYLKKALEINPEMGKALFSLALVEEALGNSAEAIACYKKELEFEPQNFKSAFNLAELLAKAEKWEEALLYYKKAISANPSFHIPYFMIAKYYLDKKENLEEAIKLCEQGIAFVSQDKYTALGYYILSDIYSYLGDKNKSDFYYIKGKSVLH
ncbi:MAG: sulfatase-like hydrolase/transferase [Candidatus Aminicenantales bacterium]